MSLIRGVLLAGPFRTHHDLNGMSQEDQRNTLIVEMAAHSNQSIGHYQSLNNADLAGTGAVMVVLRKAKIRNDADLKNMSTEDQRNTLIVEIEGQTHLGISTLQGLSNIDLVLMALGKEQPGNLRPSVFIRGVLLAGNLRTQHELDKMSGDDQRNTLIVEMVGHSNQSTGHFQSLNDFPLAGVGAVMVFLREARIRNDADLKNMSTEDQRNTLIVEIEGQTHLGISRLQSLANMDLVLTGLGVDPVFPVVKPKDYVFMVDSVEIKNQKADNDHSDSDWLTMIVSIGDPVTKNVQTLPPKTIHIEGNIKTGNVINGNFATDSFIAKDSDVVIITYLLMNLGSSRIEDQVAQAGKVTDQVVQIVGPIVGTAVGIFFGQPGEGFKIGEQIAKGFDTALKALSDIFDFLGIHAGPPNCNGEVVNDVLVFQPGELAQAVGRPASREKTGPQENARCGGAPVTKVNFLVFRPSEGLIQPPA
jgi:hypothetical protein